MLNQKGDGASQHKSCDDAIGNKRGAAAKNALKYLALLCAQSHANPNCATTIVPNSEISACTCSHVYLRGRGRFVAEWARTFQLVSAMVAIAELKRATCAGGWRLRFFRSARWSDELLVYYFRLEMPRVRSDDRVIGKCSIAMRVINNV